MKKYTALRWIVFFCGLIVLALGVTLTIKGQRFGVGSWDVLHIGLFKQLGLSIGSWSIIMGVSIIVISSLGFRSLPHIGTFINMTIVGLLIDLFNWLLPDANTFFMQLISFIIGIILLGIGAGMYISAELGAGPRDTLMLLFVEKFNTSITIARTTMEIVVAIIGYLLGGPIGVGTVIMAFAMGPIIQVSLRYWKEMLEKSLSREREVAG